METVLKHKADIMKKFMNLSIRDDRVQCMYVWIDGTGQSLRVKSKTLSTIPQSPSDCPKWTFCGSATGFASGNLATLQLVPRALYNDPFRGGNAKLVLCDVYELNDAPVPANSRFDCAQLMDKINAECEPWFGIEQEYTLFDGVSGRPLGWPVGGFPAPQGSYYCGIGAGIAIGRDIVESHYRACLYAGIPIAGSNAEVMPSQWEFQVGPCKGISIGDDLWMARFILIRLAEEFGVKVSFDPKPISGDWNGAGAHFNFSTKQTRTPNTGLEVINKYIDRLKKNHEKSIAVYDANGGMDNVRRLTGKHDTSNISEFTQNTEDRGASVRIPKSTIEDGCGYLEDRRPAANCDPYKVAASVVQVCLID